MPSAERWQKNNNGTQAVDSAMRAGQTRSRSATQPASAHKRDADAENVVHQPDEEDVVVEQRKCEQREHRPAADQGAVERQAAGHDQREHADDEHLAGEVNVHHARQQRHDQVHRQIGNHLPVDLVEMRELRVLRQRRDHFHARQMIDVVRQRRQRVRPDRDRNEQHEGCEQHADLRRRETVRARPHRRGIGNNGLVRLEHVQSFRPSVVDFT